MFICAGNVGAVFLAMGDFDNAVDCHTKHLRLARKLNNPVEEARAFSNLATSHHFRRNFSQAIIFHEQVLRIAQNLGDKSIEARAYAGKKKKNYLNIKKTQYRYNLLLL